MNNELTNEEVDRVLNQPVPFDAACDARVAQLFKQKWIKATAPGNRAIPQCGHALEVKCSRCCNCDECEEIQVSDAEAAFEIEFPNWTT